MLRGLCAGRWGFVCRNHGLQIPSGALSTRRQAEFLLEEARVAAFVGRSCSGSCQGVRGVGMNASLGFFPPPRCQPFWNIHPFSKLFRLLWQIQKLVAAWVGMSKLVSLGSEAGRESVWPGGVLGSGWHLQSPKQCWLQLLLWVCAVFAYVSVTLWCSCRFAK